ncbi:transketolase [Shinella zoogloeoides]|uniref:transketolase family protein n=1 Tax=Shinella zoogloeoides TaxID=352475 RepID=UPI0028A854ED|nr:transketolase [Shinella zoogloeoides]
MRDVSSDLNPSLEWKEIDRKTVGVIRGLVADTVEHGGGHPGTAISLAPAAFLLFHKLLRHDPADPRWVGRDRFVLSVGHSSLTLYVQLFLAGYPMSLDDLKKTRTLASKAHGHPEYDVDEGIEMTTGPLGEGFAAAVGMAMAARRTRGMLDPDAPDGESIFDHTVWVFASDGDIQEGVVAEAASLAGHQQLGNLVVLWDDNHISADDATSVSISEDTLAKFAAAGWHTQRVDWTEGGAYREDVPKLMEALQAAKRQRDRPSIVALRTIIAWPSPTKQNSGKAHANPLGKDEVRGLKAAVGLNPDQMFALPDDVLDHARSSLQRGRALRAAWDAKFNDWAAKHPEKHVLLDRLAARGLPEGWQGGLPAFEAGSSIATRAASTKVLAALKDLLPEFWAGSADMNESTGVNLAGEDSFLPRKGETPYYGRSGPYGRNLHFGVREHAMAAALSGIALNGLTRACGGTFLQFAFHMLPSIRLAALMELATIYVFTHDSIALGEDGPTHQPIEHLAALRAMPGLDVIRPSDANEVVEAWKVVLTKKKGPSAFCLSRQALPVVPRGAEASGDRFAPAAGTARGAYVLAEPADGLGTDVILIATGSEVSLAIEARSVLAALGLGARVVSMPCREWFTRQSESYRASVLPPKMRARVGIEAATALGWRDLVGDSGRVVAIDRFGASAAGPVLQEQFGFTVDAVVEAAKASIAAASGPVHVPVPAR